MESPDLQRCLPPPLEFRLLPSELEPPPLDEDKILIGVPNPKGEAWPTLMPIGAMNLTVFRNKHTGDIEYEYKTQILESLGPTQLTLSHRLLNCDSSR